MKRLYIYISIIFLLLGGVISKPAEAKWWGKSNKEKPQSEAAQFFQDMKDAFEDFKNPNALEDETYMEETQQEPYQLPLGGDNVGIVEEQDNDKILDKYKKNNTQEKDKSKKETYVFPLDEQTGPLDVSIFGDNNDKKLLETTINEPSIYDDEKYTKDLDLSSDTVDFYTETDQYVAKGNARLLVKNENIQLNANEIIIDHRNYEIIAIGNVRILRDGLEYFGDYIRINTKKESSFFNNPIMYYGEITINAKSATMHANETIAKNGTALIKRKAGILISTTRMAGLNAKRFFKFNKGQGLTEQNSYKIVAKNIVAKRGEDRTDVTIKHAKIYRGKYLVGYSPLFTYSSDRSVNYVETIAPEMGNKRKIGTYFAPGAVFALPNASTLKLGPMIALDTHTDDVGLGAFARLSTPNSKSIFMYSAAKDNALVNAQYDLGNNLRFNLVVNDYVSNGWLGGQIPNYGAQLVYNKTNILNQANVRVRNHLSAGIYQDDERFKRRTNEKTTARYTWQMDMYNLKPLLSWEKYLMLGYAYQHAFNIYQTGDTMGVLRAGPRIYTDLGRFAADLTYFMGGQYGESPFMFDRYRYGQNNLRFRMQYYVNKFLSLGYHVSANIGDRDYNGEWLTENQFVVAVGLEDLKVRVGFDPVRKNTSIGFDMFLGSNKARLEFDEMKVVDFDSDMKAPKNKKKIKKKKNKL